MAHFCGSLRHQQKIRSIIVKPRFRDTQLTRTPHYNGQFALPLVEETLTCCLILTRLILKHRQERTLPLSVRINGFDFTDTN